MSKTNCQFMRMAIAAVLSAVCVFATLFVAKVEPQSSALYVVKVLSGLLSSPAYLLSTLISVVISEEGIHGDEYAWKIFPYVAGVLYFVVFYLLLGLRRFRFVNRRREQHV
jgi:hypothetical protein